MYTLPNAFIENMKKQLPKSEWEAFFSCYQQEPYKGVRLNALKGGRCALKLLLPFLEEQIPWEENGFYTQRERAGASPFHFAGLFYMQEPSAMSAVPYLEVKKGDKVLDLCSAPGGKGTQIAGYMQGEGLLVVNEPMQNRAKILSQNVERMGVKNAVVTNEMPETLAKKFPAFFDKILVDAPCSGEGMFKKNSEEALAEWSQENVELCATRQKGILHEAEKMLKKGGKLVYSTCTFAPQEDEEQVQDFLACHTNMRLLKMEKLYPHRVKGEGHFVAVFEKIDGEDLPQRAYKGKVSRANETAYRQFEKQTFLTPQATYLHEVNETLYALPEGVFDWKGVQVLRVGVRLGEVKNGRFEPNHALALSARASDCKNVCRLEKTDTRVEKYLRGETIEWDGEKGWCLVCIEDYPMGWGKNVNGVVKNHLPKGLRMMSVEL